MTILLICLGVLFVLLITWATLYTESLEYELSLVYVVALTILCIGTFGVAGIVFLIGNIFSSKSVNNKIAALANKIGIRVMKK